MQGIRPGSRQLWAATGLVAWVLALCVVGFAMSREQVAVREELAQRKVQLRLLEQILEAVREGARLGCCSASDYRDQLEARNFRALPAGGASDQEGLDFSIPIRTGDQAWLRISILPTGEWLARVGISGQYEDLEIKSWLHPLRRSR